MTESTFRAIPLRSQLILPGATIPFIVGRSRSVTALEAALGSDRSFGALLQKDRELDTPSMADLVPVGVRCKIVQTLRLPNGHHKVMAVGLERFRVGSVLAEEPFLKVEGHSFKERGKGEADQPAVEELMREVVENAARLAEHEYLVEGTEAIEAGDETPTVALGLRVAFGKVGYRRRFLYRFLASLNVDCEPGRLADQVASVLDSPVGDKLYCLTEPDGLKRLGRVRSMLTAEVSRINWDHEIREQVFMAIEEQHREIYLREQLKVILQELGDHGPVTLHNPVFRGRGFKVDRGLAFVLMPFDEEFLPVFTEIVRPVAQSLGLECVRADDMYGPQPIVEDIWRLVNEAHIILADVTGRNPNVFYEVGLAHAVGKEVVIMTQDIEDVPFDLKHLRCILYEDSVRGFRKFHEVLERTLMSLHGSQEIIDD